jgi:dolichyl-phosphate-mannose-protein mannosyltransferase
MVGIWLFCLVLRFWKITQFNTLVFDEVYYAQFARNYLTRTTFFNAHPPLSQYIIAIGIWLGSYLPSSPENMNDLTGSLLSTFSYRWINAFIGSFLPLLIGAIAYQLSRKVSYTVIAAILAALDGLLLVESRYALNNIYLVLFGLLGHLFFLMGLRSYNLKRWSYLTFLVSF